MPQPTHLQHTRETILAQFQVLDQSSTLADLTETILIRNGCYCGRRFEHAGLSAVWFIEEGEIKVFGKDGQLEQTLLAPTAAVHLPNAA